MARSYQHELDKPRGPRVQITYDVETLGSIQREKLPFIVGILANLSRPEDENEIPFTDRKFIEINLDNFDKVMAKVAPTVDFNVDNKISDEDSPAPVNVAFTFETIEDFEILAPNGHGLLNKVPSIKDYFARRNAIRDLQSKCDGNAALEKQIHAVTNSDAVKGNLTTPPAPPADGEEEGSAPDSAAVLTGLGITQDQLDNMYAAGLARKDIQKQHAQDILAVYFGEVLPRLAANDPDVLDRLPSHIMMETMADMDGRLGEQLNLILQNPSFKNHEATWRGLFYLVAKTRSGPYLKLRVLDVSLKDLFEDLEKGGQLDWEKSQIFKKVYEDEYGTFGGHPFSMLMMDHSFGRSSEDVTMLDYLSHIAAMAHTPLVTGASPDLFDMDNWTKLTEPRDLAKIFESSEAGIVKWRSFRDGEDGRYVALAMPHFLLRLPYGDIGKKLDDVNFQEIVAGENGLDNSKFLWGNSAFVLTERITNAFYLYEWPAAIRGVEGGGLVEDLPVFSFETPDGDIALKCPTEIAITDRREKELSDLGFIALVHQKNSPSAAFFGGQAVNKPKEYILPEATANAKLSSSLPYMLVTSRFAHYIKVMMRKKIGSAMTAQNVSDMLNNWISLYVLLDDNAPQSLKAARPLREARVDVAEKEGEPGAYTSVVYLRPHFQLEELTVSIRLVVELPPPPA